MSALANAHVTPSNLDVSSYVPYTGLPHEQRTLATIGGFQWNTAGADLVKLATECLERAGVPSSDFKFLHAPRDPGSIVSLVFTGPHKLQEARLAVKCSKYSHGSRTIWLDAAKTREELRPARLVHRAAEAILNLENGLSENDRRKVEKVMSGKQVKAGGTVMGYTYQGNWIWAQAAVTRYDSSSLEMVKAWIESS